MLSYHPIPSFLGMEACDLCMAIALRRLQHERLAELSCRFQAFDPGLSRELDAAAVGYETDARNLTVFYGERTGFQPVPVQKSHQHEDFEERFTGEEHFLVINAKMAHRVLVRALDAEADVVSYLEQAIARAADPSIQSLHRHLIVATLKQHRKLWRSVLHFKKWAQADEEWSLFHGFVPQAGRSVHEPRFA